MRYLTISILFLVIEPWFLVLSMYTGASELGFSSWYNADPWNRKITTLALESSVIRCVFLVAALSIKHLHKLVFFVLLLFVGYEVFIAISKMFLFGVSALDNADMLGFNTNLIIGRLIVLSLWCFVAYRLITEYRLLTRR